MNRWYEVWGDESSWPPYVLVVTAGPSQIEVQDPKEGRVVFRAPTYDEVKLWLLEDEYECVTGRMKVAD